MQRHEMIEAMRGLGLRGMAGAFDEAVTTGDCQEFRVWAGIMGKKESHYVPTQRTGDTG